MGKRVFATVVAIAASVALSMSGLSGADPSVIPQVPEPASTGASMSIDNASRDSVRQAYQQWYKPALAVPIGWTGNVPGCTAGAPSTAGQNATLSMVNYFREMVRVDPARFDVDLSAKAQKAALVMDANSSLSHTPPDSWACWSQDAYDGASHSNLFLGRSGASAVAGYMVDFGSNNLEVGHRRWVTSPWSTTMGSGSTSRANALYVIGPEAGSPTVPTVIAWPTAGYFPATLEPGGRWSLGITAPTNTTPFANARVDVREAVTGRGLNSTVVSRSSPNYGGVKTLVWQVTGTTVEPKHMDRTFRVTITGINHPSFPSTYIYYVTLFDPETVTPPTSNPVPPHIVYGYLDDLVATGPKVRFSGYAAGIQGSPTVVISRNGRTLGSVVATGPNPRSYQPWTFTQTTTAGTYTYCAHFRDSTNPKGFAAPSCKTVVVK